MPEEINRILTDHLSTLLFCPTYASAANLANEGITQGVHHVGDVMYDAARYFGEIAGRKSTILDDLGLNSGEYLLATVHRAENTDNAARLRGIMDALSELAEEHPVIFPVHPRTRQKLQELFMLQNCPGLKMIEPVSFLDMVKLEKHARCILTDSGGVQKEAYFHGVPCVTLRDETEWVETVQAGWNQLASADVLSILAAVKQSAPGGPILEYGVGCSSKLIISLLQ